MNVVILFLDDLPVATLTPEVSPHLMSRPGGQWVRMLGAVLDNPTCGPSRVTMSTGLRCRRHGAATNQATAQNFESHWFNPAQKWPAVLASAGVRCGFWGKYENGYPWANRPGNQGPAWIPPGWDRWYAHTLGAFGGSSGKGNGYFDYSLNVDGVGSDSDGSAAAYSTDVMVDDAATWIAAKAAADEPFVAFLSLFAPHDSPAGETLWHPRHDGLFDAGETFRTPNHNALMENAPAWIAAEHGTPVSQANIDSEDALVRAQWRALRAVDEGLEVLLDQLAASDVLDDTVVIFMGDNSNMSWQHRMRRKGRPMEESLSAQMMVRWPGADDRDEPRPVSNVDWAATVAALFGVTLPVAPDGTSIAPLVLDAAGEVPWREGVLCTMDHETVDDRAFNLVRGERLKYVRYWNGQQTLHDLVEDPYEMVNLAGHPDHQEYEPDRVRLARYLDRMLAVQAKHPEYEGP